MNTNPSKLGRTASWSVCASGVIFLAMASTQVVAAQPSAPAARAAARPPTEVEGLGTREHGYGDRVRVRAARLLMQGDAQRAADLLADLIAAPETPFDLAEAWRMLGESRLALQDYVGAADAFARQLQALETDPALIGRFPVLRASGTMQRSLCLMQAGRASEAADQQAKFLASPPPGADRGTIASMLINQSTILQSLGRPQEAAVVLKRAINDYADQLASPDSTLELQITAATMTHARGEAPDLVADLVSLWNSSTEASVSARGQLAMQIVTIADRCGLREVSTDIAEQAIAELDAAFAPNQAPSARAVSPAIPQELSHVRDSMLETMANANVQLKPFTVLSALLRQAELASTPSAADAARERLEEFSERLSNPQLP